MKNLNKLLVLRSVLLILFLGFAFTGNSEAGSHNNKTLLCEIECAKIASKLQQSCSSSFNTPKTKLFHNTGALVSCVQDTRHLVNRCEKKCSIIKTLIKK